MWTHRRALRISWTHYGENAEVLNRAKRVVKHGELEYSGYVVRSSNVTEDVDRQRSCSVRRVVANARRDWTQHVMKDTMF